MKKAKTTIYKLYATTVIRIPRDIINDSTFDKTLLATNYIYPIEWEPKEGKLIISINQRTPKR